MTPARWNQVERTYREVLECDPAARPAFLDAIGAADRELRREVEGLLENSTQTAGFLDRPAPELAARSMAAGRPLLAAGQRVAHYEIREKLGEGGMGVVWKAEDLLLKRVVALKFLHASDDLPRLLREAQVAAALNHPNICTIHEVNPEGGFLVMELVEGESLSAMVARRPLPLDHAVELATQICEGLKAAHAKGIIHRDIKSGNVLVTADGRTKILDFGLARAPGQVALTREGVRAGTPGYMAPEQWRGEAADCRTDIWAVGAVLHEMLTGRLPMGQTETLPEGLEQVVRKALAADPGQRYQKVEDMLAELRRVTAAALPQASIVILPFAHLSPDPDNAFFADGLTDELIAELSRIRSLRVISRTSAMLFKGARKSIPAIAQELNVRYVLEGTVRRAGNHVRITSQLIDGTSDANVWAGRYSGTLDDIFEVQEQMARRIVEALRVSLTADEDHSLAARQIPDVRAFERYLRARQVLYLFTKEGLDDALSLANEALRITGPNALLFATLAEVYYWYSESGIRTEQTLESAASWAARALELSSDCALAFQVKGLIAKRRGDTLGALRDLGRAVDLGGGAESLWMLGWVCAQTGRMDEARRYADRLVSVDPRHPISHITRALVALIGGNAELACRIIGPGATSTFARVLLGVCFAYAGHSEQACELFGQAAASSEPFAPTCAILQAALQHDEDAFQRSLGDNPALELARSESEICWWLADSFSLMGHAGEALHWLENAIQIGFVNERFWSECDPFLAPLRTDPRFLALMNRARDRQREMQA